MSVVPTMSSRAGSLDDGTKLYWTDTVTVTEAVTGRDLVGRTEGRLASAVPARTLPWGGRLRRERQAARLVARAQFEGHPTV
jgi:hypothetical protein